MLTRDQLIKEARARQATFPSVLMVYASLVGMMVFSAMSIL
jgi:hypothetical protein